MSVRFACGVVAATSFDVEDCGTKVSACKIGRAVVERLNGGVVRGGFCR